MSYTTTTNGAVSLKTTGSNIVDYFMLFVRDLDKNVSYEYLEKCWKEDPKKTVAIIFNGRDRVNGKKEKKVANQAMLWLRTYKFATYCDNLMNYIDKYGCWKDLLYITYYLNANSHSRNYEMKLFSSKLLNDKLLLEDNNSVSLCAKWAPSENDRNDKRKHMAKRVATEIYGLDDDKRMEKYRKEIIVPLRKKINIVETLMCSGKWGDIKYQAVPGVASKRLLNTFIKHDKERYLKYLEDVRSGKAEIKVTGILPHELSKYYIDTRHNDDYGPNETIELQWRTILENVKNSGNFDNSLAIVDLSGSMFGAINGSIPAQVAVSLGILTSQCCNGLFKNKFITFSEEPELVTLEYKEPSLFESLNSMMNVSYGFSTDFVKCCEAIISYGIKHNIPDSEMPKKLFVFTDMQFNEASDGSEELETIYQNIIKKYKKSGYTAPKFVFWNLNSDNQGTFPVNCDTEGTAMVSGFSEQLLKIFMNYDEFKPEFIVNEILNPYLDSIIISDD